MRSKYSWPLVVICTVVLVTLALAGEGRLWGQKADGQAVAVAAAGSFEFQLELDGQPMDVYSACSGLGSSHEIEEEMSWTDAGLVITQKTPGALQWHNVTLKRETPSSTNVWQWRRAMEDGNLAGAIRSGSIVMTRPGSSGPVARWNFRDGWAARLVFDGSGEVLTIVHEGLEFAGAGGAAPLIRTR